MYMQFRIYLAQEFDLTINKAGMEYPHFGCSTENPKLVTYGSKSVFCSSRNGEVFKSLPKHETMRFGKMVKKFFGDYLDTQQIEKCVHWYNHLTDPREVKFAKTQAECEGVYIEGPNSCMSGRGFSTHPARCYGDSPDVCVAYIEENGKILARSVVWPDRKIHTSIYGNHQAMRNSLVALGYTEDETEDGEDFEGARLSLVKDCNGSYVAPYVDFSPCQADISGGYLVITECGEYTLQNTCGYLEEGESCSCCGERVNLEQEGSYLEYHGAVCDGCLESDFFFCSYYEDYVSNDDTQTVQGVRVSDDYVNNSGDFAECEGSGETIFVGYNCPYGLLEDDYVILEDGTFWSRDYFNDNGFQCGLTGELHSNDDKLVLEDGTETTENNANHNLELEVA